MNKIDQQTIKNYFSDTVFARGKSYYEKGKVKNLTYDAKENLWSAKVAGSQVYDAGILIEEQYIENFCNCPAHRSYGNCKHVCAVLLAVADEQQKSGRNPTVNGTKNARYRQANDLMNYFGGSVPDTDIVAANDKRLLKVEFLLRTRSQETYNQKKEVFDIQLKIGESRLYVVKDIQAFLQSVDNQTELKFGKNFTFSAEEHIFSTEDLEIIEKLIEIERTESFYDSKDYYWASGSGKKKELLIPFYAADELLLKLQHLNCKYEQQFMVYGQLQLIEEGLPFSFVLDHGRSGEFQLKLNGNADGHYYESYGWYAEKGRLYKVAAAQQRALQPFKEWIGGGKKPAIPISKEQVGKFISQALPKIKQVGKVEVSEKVSGILVNPPLRVKLFVEGSAERIDAKVEYHYDALVINPLRETGDSFGDSDMILIRDTEKEQKFMETLENYPLRVRDARLYIETEKDLFDFLYEALPELEEQAEIYLTSSVKSLILPASPKTAVAVNIPSTGNLLEVDFTMVGFSKKEVLTILQSVIEKKRYMRLPNGAFLSLVDEQLRDIAEVYQELTGKSPKAENGKLELPLYRGLQLEERLTQLDKESRKFGKNFRQFFTSIKFPEEEDFQVPAGLQANLRDYQITGFRWLKSLAKYQLGGILADDMGLGKTLQCIAFVQSEMEDGSKKPFLIVSPASLVYNWKNEFAKFAPSVRVDIATGTVQERKEILGRSETPDVYITSYHTLRQDLEWYAEQEFHAFIMDEAQAIKNFSSKISQAVRSIAASQRFALSGTPIENSLDELWSVFQAVMPGFLYNQKTFRGLPQETIARLVKPFVLRRLKQNVLKELPDKIETVHYSELNTEQKKLYLAYLDKIRAETKESLETGSLGKERIKILAGLTRLRQLCCHPSLFIENYEGQSGKLEELLEIIQNARENGRRMLIFSQFSSMLKIIQEKLGQTGQNCFYLDGQTPAKERVQLVDAFNEGAESIFLISLKAGGTGLNLTGADMVVLYDLWWNPAIEEQAIGRAHRMGQKNVVQVIRLIAQGTIEEKINELQRSKKELIDQIIQPGETMLSSLSEDDIRQILSI